MKKENVLYLEKRGCDFSPADNIGIVSDIGNYRVTTPDYTVPGKDGNLYFLEFTSCNRTRTRYINKRTGAALKKPVVETVLNHALFCNAQFEDNNGSWGNIRISRETMEKPRLYTMENILNLVNSISTVKYTAVEFIDR